MARSNELPPEAHVVDVMAFDYAFGMPTEIPSGWTTFRMTNRGEEHHVMVIQRMPDGVTWEEWRQGWKQWEETAEPPEWASEITTMGGPGLLAPGRTGETSMYLEPGTYVMGCGVYTPEGVSHGEMGMELPVTVTAARSGAPEPAADIEVTLHDFEMVLDGAITPGTHRVRVRFEDRNDHDIHLARLGEGATSEDVIQWMATVQEPAPVQFLGGVEQMPTGETAYFTVDLEPGHYVWIGHEYGGFGMAKAFTIPESELPAHAEERSTRKADAPAREVEILVREHDLQAPVSVPEGRTTLRVRNEGAQSHGLMLLRLRDGFTPESLRATLEAWEDGQYDPTTPWPAFPGVSIVDSLSPGDTGELTLPLAPATYVLLDFAPDTDGIPHYRKGEMHAFTVR